MSTTVLQAMTATYSSLTRSGKKVADFIFSHTDEAQYMSISSLADECSVGEATITRFCRVLGYGGYNEFKLALATASGTHLSESEGGMLVFDSVKPTDSIAALSKKLYGADVMAMRETMNLIRPETIALAVSYLSNANRVYCFGQGGSGVMAMEAWTRFAVAAPQFQSIQDSHLQAMAASLCTPQDVIWFFSYSGATKESVDVLRTAQKQGAKIILVTHFSKCPIAAYADVILLCGSKESPLQSGSIAAKMGQLFLIDVVYTEYCRVNADDTAVNRSATANAIATRLL